MITSTTYVVTVYSHDKPDTDAIDSLLYETRHTYGAFDVAVEPTRRWVMPLNRWGSIVRDILTNRRV